MMMLFVGGIQQPGPARGTQQHSPEKQVAVPRPQETDGCNGTVGAQGRGEWVLVFTTIYLIVLASKYLCRCEHTHTHTHTHKGSLFKFVLYPTVLITLCVVLCVLYYYYSFAQADALARENGELSSTLSTREQLLSAAQMECMRLKAIVDAQKEDSSNSSKGRYCTFFLCDVVVLTICVYVCACVCAGCCFEWRIMIFSGWYVCFRCNSNGYGKQEAAVRRPWPRCATTWRRFINRIGIYKACTCA